MCSLSLPTLWCQSLHFFHFCCTCTAFRLSCPTKRCESFFLMFDRLDGLNCLMWLVVFLLLCFIILDGRGPTCLPVTVSAGCLVGGIGCKNNVNICFFQFPVTQFSGGQHAETGLDYLHQHPGAAGFFQRGTLFSFRLQQHEVFGNRVNLLTQLGTFLSPVAPVGCSQCSTMFLLFHYVIMSLCS